MILFNFLNHDSLKNCALGAHSGKTLCKITRNIQEYYFYQQQKKGTVVKETSQENKFCVHCAEE